MFVKIFVLNLIDSVAIGRRQYLHKTWITIILCVYVCRLVIITFSRSRSHFSYAQAHIFSLFLNHFIFHILC